MLRGLSKVTPVASPSGDVLTYVLTYPPWSCRYACHGDPGKLIVNERVHVGRMTVNGTTYAVRSLMTFP